MTYKTLQELINEQLMHLHGLVELIKVKHQTILTNTYIWSDHDEYKELAKEIKKKFKILEDLCVVKRGMYNCEVPVCEHNHG